MKDNSKRFEFEDNHVISYGYSELEGYKGFLIGEDVALFYKGEYGLYIVNTVTGRIRQMSTTAGMLLVDDNEIDYEAICKCCKHGAHNAKSKAIRYAGMSRWGNFKDGLCVISWMLYPDGMYFADSDGFGMVDNDEEMVYAIIDTNLDLVEPFRPVKDVDKYIEEIRKTNCETTAKKNRSMKTRIFNLIILDESGSMQSIKSAAINSVNETIQTIRSAQEEHVNQEHFATLVTFNSKVKTVYECVPADEVAELTSETYHPESLTALYDAMGLSLGTLRPKVADVDKVLVTVVTDGYENASREYSSQTIKSLVNELKGKGWVFAYIGANQDAITVAQTMSITNALDFEATHEGTISMTEHNIRSRRALYARMAKPDFNADEANFNFFNEEK